MGEARRRRKALELWRRTPAEEEALIHRLVEVAPKHIDTLASRTTIECIEAAAIGLQVLRRVGISAIERPVAVDALNPQMAEALRADVDPASFDPYVGDEWVESMGHREGLRTPIQWEGHLVISTVSGWLIDLWPSSRPEHGLDLPAGICLPTRTLPATYSMPDGALIAYYDKPLNRFYRLVETWPRGYPEWRSTIDAIVSELSAEPESVPVRGDGLFTRCSDELGIREYVARVFEVCPPEHVWDLARAFDVRPERIWDVEKAVDVISALSSQDAVEELVALESRNTSGLRKAMYEDAALEEGKTRAALPARAGR